VSLRDRIFAAGYDPLSARWEKRHGAELRRKLLAHARGRVLFERGNVLIDRLEEILSLRLPNVTFKRYAKPTFTKPAPDEVRRAIVEESDFVVEALAD